MFDGMGGGSGVGFGGPFMILFWIVVTVGVVVLVKWLLDQSSTGKGSRDKSALEIVRERDARGEINREEYGLGIGLLRRHRLSHREGAGARCPQRAVCGAVRHRMLALVVTHVRKARYSEHAFRHVLGFLAQAVERARRRDRAAWMPALAAVSELLTTHGKFSLLMSDGDPRIAYGHDRLHRAGQHGADPSTATPLRRVVVATKPIAGSKGWVDFEPGERCVYRLDKLAGRILTQPSPAPRLSDNGELVSTSTFISARHTEVPLAGYDQRSST